MAPSIQQRLTNRALRTLGTAAKRFTAKMPSATEVQPGVLIGKSVDGAHNVMFEGAVVVGRGTSFQGKGIEIRHGTTVGIGCVFNGPLEIGRFSQFGSYVGIYGVDHPIDVPVPNVNGRFIDGRVGELGKVDAVRIGHGCWIGHGAVILRGVTVGNGSVIGAGSVVRSDVPSYSIVTGVPAGDPRPRFDKKLAGALDAVKWWEWSDDERTSRRDLFLTSFRDDPDQARELLAQILHDRVQSTG